MINLRFLNTAIGKVSTDEFAVLYVIANNPKLQKEGRVRLYREQIADKVGWLNDRRPEYGLKKVTKVTNSLEESGWLKKDVVYETPKKCVIYYSLNTQKIGEKCDSSEQKIDEKLSTFTQKSIPVNNTYNPQKNKKTYKSKNTQNTEELGTACSPNSNEEEMPF